MTERKSRIPMIVITAISLLLVTAVTLYFTTHANAADQNKTDTKSASQKKDEKEVTPIPVRAVPVTQGRIAAYITATANLVAENEVKVIAEWEGRVTQLNVEEGNSVGAGQVLAALARTDSEIAANKARAKAANTQIKFERAKRLVEKELLAPEEYEKLLVENEIAQHEVKEAEWNLEKTMIRSPFAGRITQRMVQPGQHVRPGDELFVVTDFDPLIARIYLPETDVVTLELGRPVRLTLKADERVQVAAKIRQISPVVDTATGTIKVTVEVSSAPATVRPGAFVQVDIVREARDAALLVPRDTVVRELQKTFVFVAKDGIAHKRQVSLGLEENLQFEIASGLAVGEQVIIAGQGSLKDGAPIKLLDTKLDTQVGDSLTAP